MIKHKLVTLYFFLVISFNAFAEMSTGVALNEKEILKELRIEVALDDEWIVTLNTAGILKNVVDTSVLPAIKQMPALFKAYPTLVDRLAYINLGSLPTPVRKLKRLGKELGISHLYVKDDGLTGACDEDGEHCYGGNKVRKLEFLLADALIHGAKRVITFGCAGSNHAVATSVYARKLGLKPICMLRPQANSRVVRQNLALHAAYDAQLHYFTSNEARKLATVTTWLNQYRSEGVFPYLIPTGGSNALGAVGFVNAAFELKQQIEDGLLPEPDFIYVACGSKGTAAGLVLGVKATGLKSKIVAVPVELGSEATFKKGILNLARKTNELLHDIDSYFQLYDLFEDDVIIKSGFVGKGYAVFNPEGMQAKKIMQEMEHLRLDGTYTAKACAGMCDDCALCTDKNKVILFWNTYCGLDFSAVTQAVDYHRLPVSLHDYFESDVQELDRN